MVDGNVSWPADADSCDYEVHLKGQPLGLLEKHSGAPPVVSSAASFCLRSRFYIGDCEMRDEVKVLQGKDGWLFLSGGNNDFMSYLYGHKVLSKHVLDGWESLLQSRQDWFARKGIKYLHVFAPEKVSVYGEYLDSEIDLSKGHIRTLSRQANGLFLDILHYFNSIKKDYNLYTKTDTHWSYVGAFVCYQLLCSVLGYKPYSDLIQCRRETVKVSGDLGLKMDPVVKEDVESVIREKKAIRSSANILVRYKEKNKCFNELGLHVGSRVVFQNPDPLYAEKVVIFGDSFSEYRPNRLTEMFAETFAEVHFCWSAGIDYEYVEKVSPQIVISELCERFAHIVPNDHIDVEKFARSRLKEYMKDRLRIKSNSSILSEQLTTCSGAVKNVALKKKRMPDYIIVGGMKCGTTILNDFIVQHPGIAKAKQKEIHYFTLNYTKGNDWYSSFFEDVADDMLTGEASPTYLDLTNNVIVPSLIKVALPNVKIIAIIKDPVQRAISHFLHLRDVNKIDVFQGRKMEDYFLGDLYKKYFVDFANDPRLLPLRNVLDFGLYDVHLRAYRQIFKQNFLLLSNAELWTNGKQVMSKVFDFLNVAPFEAADFERKRYVTSAKEKIVSSEVFDNLTQFYEEDYRRTCIEFGMLV